MKQILLSHDGGSAAGNKLVKKLFLKRFGNSMLDRLEDAAQLGNIEKAVFSTDSFTVSPYIFPGGNIGKLAVAGTCNDLAVSCARPLFLSSSFMIEEGFAMEDLELIVESMAKESELNGAAIVCGDTKIVPRGALDGIFINVSGIGSRQAEYPGAAGIREGDALIVSGPVGDHGAAILMKKKGLEFDSALESDCRSLWPDISSLLKRGIPVTAMRDITRGGLAGILHEWSGASGCGMQVIEEKIPVREEVQGFGELTGIDPFHLACEGTFLLSVAAEHAGKALEVMHGLGMDKASVIGNAAEKTRSQGVRLLTGSGASRNLEMPSGEHLPRIC